MTKGSRDALLQALAKDLAWTLFAAAGHGRVRARICVDRFDREFRSAKRLWKATHQNLTNERSNRK